MAFLPPLLLLLFGAWAGTFAAGATFAGSATGQAVLLGTVVGAAARDPYRFDLWGLGRAGRWWLPALGIAAVASWWASPVPRAGRVGLLLLPAFLLLPAAVASVWSDRISRRRGLRGLAGVVAGISLWALVDHLVPGDLLAGGIFSGSPRAARPLGHHNLLAVWLLTVLPSAVLPIRERSTWRWLGWAAGVLGTAALLATRSLLGAAGLGGLALMAGIAVLRADPGGTPARPRSRVRLWTGVVLGLLLALLAWRVGPRLVEVVAGDDPSARARAVYWEGGLRGVSARPFLGWGPGATPWTLGLHLRPRPGINPPGEAVGQLHSQPLQVAYELGATGLLLALAISGLFVGRRWREVRSGEARDPALTVAGLAGLGAAGVALLGTAALAIPAVPVALAVVAGMARAGGTGLGRSPRPRPALPGTSRAWRVAVVVYAAVAVAGLIAPARAHFLYDRALELETKAAAGELAAATALDPDFPWYRAWSAWWGGTGPLGRHAAAEPALEAARDAPGVAPLWLMAGVYGRQARAPWADEALARACRRDPLSPFAPFHRMVGDPTSPEAPVRGARALLAEPRLLAATFWDHRPSLLAAALTEVERWPGVPTGWKAALLDTAERMAERRTSPGSVSPADRGELVLRLDRDPATSLALHLFRRRPRSLPLAAIEVDRREAEEVNLPPASHLPETSIDAFGEQGCRSVRAPAE